MGREHGARGRQQGRKEGSWEGGRKDRVEQRLENFTGQGTLPCPSYPSSGPLPCPSHSPQPINLLTRGLCERPHLLALQARVGRRHVANVLQLQVLVQAVGGRAQRQLLVADAQQRGAAAAQVVARVAGHHQERLNLQVVVLQCVVAVCFQGWLGRLKVNYEKLSRWDSLRMGSNGWRGEGWCQARGAAATCEQRLKGRNRQRRCEGGRGSGRKGVEVEHQSSRKQLQQGLVKHKQGVHGAAIESAKGR